MNGKIKYEFMTKMWKHNSLGGWHFISLPLIFSKEIRENLGWQEEGWGRMKALAEIEGIRWKTAIWFDTKMKTYVLPIKSEIRKKVNLKINMKVEISVWV